MSDELSRDADPLSDLYRQIPPLDPPAHLDTAILRVARQSVISRRRMRRWALPASMAALLVLSIGLVRLTVREMPQAIHPESTPGPAVVRSEGASAAGRVEERAHTAKLRSDAPTADTASPSPASPEQEAGELPANRPARESTAPPAAPASFSSERRKAPAQEEFRRRENEPRSPARWLEDIAELRRQGRAEEAQASWEAFRRQYPDYPVDESLKPPGRP
jgi:hypothetical protein